MNRLRALWETIRNLLRPPAPPVETVKESPLRYTADLKTMAAIRKVQFVIRLADGRYYSGPGPTPGTVLSDFEEARAQRFESRWQAVTVCSGGPVFAQSAIVEASDGSEGARDTRMALGLPPAGGVRESKE